MYIHHGLSHLNAEQTSMVAAILSKTRGRHNP